MRLLEDKLEALDIYFAPKKESEKWLLILGVAGIIGYLAYTLLLPYTEELYKTGERNKNRIQRQIKNNLTYLNSITQNGDRDFLVKKYTQDIIHKNKQIVHLRDKIKFINSNLEKLSDLLYNKKSWSRFLNSITQKAEVHNVDLEYIHSKNTTSKGSFGHVLEITLGAKGTYKNIVKFMNEVEQNVLVTDIFKTDFSLDSNSSNIKADIYISVWGINH
jgi:Tfp pilus assembly protein PilO